MTFRDIIGRNEDDGVAWHEHDAGDISGEAVFTDLKVDKLLGGKITGKEIIVAGGTDGILRSDNFVADTSGWQIVGDGSAEFNDVTVRGTIEATAGELGDLLLAGRLTTAGDIRVGQKVDINDDPNWHGISIDPSGFATQTALMKNVSTGRTVFRVNYNQAGGSISFDSTASPALVITGGLVAASGSNLSADYITTGTITAQTVTIGSSGVIQGTSNAWRISESKATFGGGSHTITLDPSDYPAGQARFRTDHSGGYLVNGGVSYVWDYDPSLPYILLRRSSRSADVVTNLALLSIGPGLTVFGPVGANDGSASSPAYQFRNDTDTGLSLRGADEPQMSAGGTVAMRWRAGSIVSQPIYDNTSAAAADVGVTSAGILYRSTSSKRYKTDLRGYDGPSVTDLTPTMFRSRLPGDGDTDRLGLIAEDVAERFPLAAIYDDQGRPDAIDWNAIVSGLVAEVRTLRARVGVLEAA